MSSTSRPERHLALEGGINFRDLGGYHGHGGRAVRWGRLFRSGRLNGLTAADQARLGALRLGVVVDFRQQAERDREPSRWDGAGPRTHTVDIVPGSAESFFQGSSEASLEHTARFMEYIYRDLAVNQNAAYAGLFRAVLEAGDQGVLMHCAAGKDRTGFGSALLLSALGVDRETVMEDYLLTGRLLDADQEMAHVLAIAPFLLRPPFTRETIRPMFEVRRSYLEAAFQAVEETAGTVEAYLDRRLGVGPRDVQALRERYLA